jgi:hypothetical protein
MGRSRAARSLSDDDDCHPLSDERVAQLPRRAEQAGLAPEEFLRRRVEQLLDRPDEQFRRAGPYILEKNAELYRRLA